MFGVNVDGYFWMAQAAIPHLLATNGTIINIASNAGFMGQAYTVAYCTTKGAVVNLTRALAMEFIKQPIRINAIAPGGVDTSLAHNFRIPKDIDGDLMMRYNPLRGMAQADDIANLFAFMASDEARNIHGAIISSDGGVTAG
jgi:meso-butanediol dehydrogenase / (S,S)-butanediol dehydrogenase / diacetyl reductase